MKRLFLLCLLTLLPVGCNYEFHNFDDCWDNCDGEEDCIAICRRENPNDRWGDNNGGNTGTNTPPATGPSDRDGDGIPDDREADCNTSPDLADTDGDGILDGAEDPDGDGYTNIEEIEAGSDPADGTDCPPKQPEDVDSDNDGLSDANETTWGTDPQNPDCDDDGMTDGAEVDRGTDPLEWDTDGDGICDGDEVACGSSPLDPVFTCDGQPAPECVPPAGD